MILLRHGRFTASTAGVLAGRSEGAGLDEKGGEHARAVVGWLAELPIVGIVTSPLLRCQQTVAPLAQARGLPPQPEPRLVDVDYGSRTGKELKSLLGEPLWKVVQQHPAAAVFPEGEGVAQVQARAQSVWVTSLVTPSELAIKPGRCRWGAAFSGSVWWLWLRSGASG